MIRGSITQDRTARYVDEYLENSSAINYTDLSAKNKHVSVFYDELYKTEIDGYPVASDYVDETGKVYCSEEFKKLSDEKKATCRLRYHYMPYSHELYVGTTGSGKTTGCIEPQLRAISSQKNKPNLFITDPKGELFERSARHLSEQGYKIYVLNFKDITHSDKWNPLLEMYEKQLEKASFGKDCKLRTGFPDDDLEPFAPIEEFNGQTYIELDGKAFPNGEICDNYIAFRRDFMEAEVTSMVNQFANMMIKVQSKTDASWEHGAQQLLKGILLCMLEDAIDPNSGFTREMMTFFTIRQYYDKLRTEIAGDDRDYNVNNHPLLKNKSRSTVIHLNVALNNAPNTMKSYCGVFEGSTKDWFQGHIFALTTGCTIDIDDIGDRPYAIFNITRDYDKSDFTVAGMFIDWVYRHALQQAESSVKDDDGRPTTRPLHFLLDEFGNIPEIRDFENKISTSRSRNIWFHLVVQSYEQIDIVYSQDKATVICDNCNAQIFLGAQSRATKEKFSKECGMRWVPSLASRLTPNDTSLTQVAVLPISSLDLINEGELYIKRLYLPVIKSQYIRSYICAQNGDFTHFRDKNAYRNHAPINIEPFNSPKYNFAPLTRPTKSDDDY